MKAIILAGGLGTRLRPLTDTIPKPLVEVQGKTLTEQVLDIYKKIGVTEIFLSVSYMADKMKEHFGTGEKFGVKISYLEETSPRGTAGPLLILKEQGKNIAEDFFVSNGDNLFALDLKEMMKFHQQHQGLATIALKPVDDVTSSGVARLQGDAIVEFVEKPKAHQAPSNLISSGYYILAPRIFDLLPANDFLMLEKDIWPALAEAGDLYGFVSDAQWFDTGTLERYQQVNKEWKGV